MSFESEVIELEKTGHVATIWLSRPDERNAWNSAMWEDLPRAMEAVGADDEVRAVVIAGRGPAFTVGLDLAEFGPLITSGKLLADADPPSEVSGRRHLLDTVKRFQQSITAVADCSKPVIAAIWGWCLGAGIDLASACDIRLAAEDAVFSIRETKLAMVADVGTLQRLPKILSPGHVAELAFTGRDIDAARALEIGLVNDLLPDAEAALKAARELADEIAQNSPLAVQGTKAVLRAGEGLSIEEALDYVALWNAAFLSSEDLREAIAAFAEKRQPHFRGR